MCSYFLFWFLEKKKKKKGGRGGGVGTVFAHAMLLVVLPTFQLVTKLTEEKNKRRVFCIPFEYPANIILLAYALSWVL